MSNDGMSRRTVWRLMAIGVWLGLFGIVAGDQKEEYLYFFMGLGTLYVLTAFIMDAILDAAEWIAAKDR